MSKLLPNFRFGHSLVMALASLCLVTVSLAQTPILDEFFAPADEHAEEAELEEMSPEIVPEEGGVDIPYEDLLPEDSDSDAGIDLLVLPDDKSGDSTDGDGTGNDEDGNEDQQPTASPEAELDTEAKLEPIADPSLAELVSDGKQPSSWLSLDGSICSHWVRLTRTSELRGKINVLQADGRARGVAELKVAIYRNSKRVGEDVTDDKGRFSFSKVKSGVYSMLVTGPGGFAAYGVHALSPLGSQPDNDVEGEDEEPAEEQARDKEEVAQRRPRDDFVQLAARRPASARKAPRESAKEPVNVSETLSISTAAVPPISFGQLKSIIQEYGKRLDPEDMTPPASLPEQAWDDLIATAIEEKKPGYDEPEGPEMYRGTKELEKNPVNHVRSPALGNFDVPLVRYGNGLMMRGRMVGTDPVNGRPTEVAENSTTVTLIRNDQRVATSVIRAGGEFDFRNLTPGIYSIVAVGDAGFGAISFRAVEKQRQANNNSANIHFVQQPLNEVIEPSTVPIAGDVVIGGPAVVSGAGGGSVPLCCDPACARDAVEFCRPRRPLAAVAGIAGLTTGVVALADAPVELGGTPAVSSGFQGTAGGVGGGGAAIGLGAIGIGAAALALEDDEPIVSPSQ